MDPMDYTMDEGGNHGNPGNNSAAARYQCQQSSPPSAQNGFSSQHRDGAHFDPVHDASNYYYGLNPNAPARSAYTGPQHQPMQHWAVPPYMPGASWQGFGDMMRPNPAQGGPESSSYRGPGRNYGDMSWGGSRAFGRLEDTYGPFSNQLSGHNLPSDNSMGPGGNGPSGSAGQPSALRPSPFAQSYDQQSMDLPAQSGPSHNRVPSLGTSRANRYQNPSHSFPEPPSLRYQRAPRPSHSRPGVHGSAADRLSWGESDEESISDLENEAVRREVASYRESEEEQALIMQGALAAGRRMMAKEAFGSLEKMKVEDLPNESKDCTICYNDFGVENPDGVVEQPVRWPKCKHLFGDKCIKRWFDEGKDTCPYCREKIPSEMAAKRLGMESQMRMMQRRRMMHAAATGQQQARHGVPQNSGFFPEDTASGRHPSTPSQFIRSQDEFEAMANRNAESWSYSSPHRYSPGESPERRRQGRGRMTGGRSGHPAGRPVSIGSARSVSQSFSFHHNPPQRGFGPPIPSLHTPTSARRSITPGLPRQTPTQPQTPQARASASLPGSSSASPEEASPPVAVGSGLPARHRFSVDSTPSFARDNRATAGANGPQRYQRFWNEANALEQRLNASLQRGLSAPEIETARSSNSMQPGTGSESHSP